MLVVLLNLAAIIAAQFIDIKTIIDPARGVHSGLNRIIAFPTLFFQFWWYEFRSDILPDGSFSEHDSWDGTIHF